jgi:hypothetical protein
MTERTTPNTHIHNLNKRKDEKRTSATNISKRTDE